MLPSSFGLYRVKFPALQARHWPSPGLGTLAFHKFGLVSGFDSQTWDVSLAGHPLFKATGLTARHRGYFTKETSYQTD
jgi:hypothetical protein